MQTKKTCKIPSYLIAIQYGTSTSAYYDTCKMKVSRLNPRVVVELSHVVCGYDAFCAMYLVLVPGTVVYELVYVYPP